MDMKYLHKTLSVLALAASALTFSGIALAAPKNVDGTALAAKAKAKKNDKRVTFEATFGKWIVSPRGEIVGMILGNGGEVRVSARRYTLDASKLQPGDVVHVEANEHALPDGTIYSHPLIKKGLDTIVDASGKPNVTAQPGTKPKLQKMKTSGNVAGFLLDGKDRKIAVVLDGGAIGWAHSDLSKSGLKKGDAITVEGMGGNWSHGTALSLKQITKADGSVVACPHHGKKKGGKKTVQ